MVDYVVDQPPDGEWTYVAGSQLVAKLSKTNVLGGEPDLLSQVLGFGVRRVSTWLFSLQTACCTHKMSPRPSFSCGTSGSQLEWPIAHLTRETGSAGSQVHTGKG